jgi:excisionase family DNA binding protein
VSINIPEPSWAVELPAEQILAALNRLAALQSTLVARLIADIGVKSVPPATAGPLVDAPEMARLLNVHESWVRGEARRGRIPCQMVGRYMRFRAADVQAAIIAREGGP